jgi:hypothetical protein
MGLLAHGMYVLQALLSADACASTAHIWYNAVSMAAGVLQLALFALMGKDRFVVSRGVHSVWQRLLFATGVLFNSRPGNCAAAGYCQLLWQHRLFLVHLVGAVARVPCLWFWIGGVVSWLAAVAVDVADPGVTCETIVCVLAALQKEMTEQPLWFMNEVIWVAVYSSRVFALDVVLPGLLLTWLELRARRAWWQQQQERQQQALRHLRSESAANKKQQAAAAAVAAAAAAAAAAATASMTAAASSSSSSSSAALTAPRMQHQQEPPVTFTPASLTSNQVNRGSAAAGVTAKPAGVSTNAAVTSAEHAAAPAGAMRTQQGGPFPYPAAVSLPVQKLPPAQHGQQCRRVLCCSPVQRYIVSLKFSKAPGTGERVVQHSMCELHIVKRLWAGVAGLSCGYPSELCIYALAC